nr:hypothetical protein CFP56_11553 [Quercus suber]
MGSREGILASASTYTWLAVACYGEKTRNRADGWWSSDDGVEDGALMLGGQARKWGGKGAMDKDWPGCGSRGARRSRRSSNFAWTSPCLPLPLSQPGPSLIGVPSVAG